jgi:hypothetical protein
MPTTSTPCVPCSSCGRIIFPSLWLAVWLEVEDTQATFIPAAE